ncbi:MAG: nucleotidyltransferase domain-containing protein [Patescibacteria group bacterium]|nr:nucleotidyltransferase domain-containing protein [Patescibacteria group bacterium]
MKRKLSNVTLLGIDCVNVERLQAAMDVSMKDIEFGAVKLLTSLPTTDTHLVPIPHIGSVEEYSRFIIEDLYKYVDTEFVLVIQYDGFILNPKSWSDEFLKYDYIGSPWLVRDWSVKNFAFPKNSVGSKIVGNGGFSIRSRKILDVGAQLAREGKIPKVHPEDVAICVWHRDLFEKEGVKFAPAELAEKFSYEGEEWTYACQFGFHGLSWTNLDDWITGHPEYDFIVDEYRKARKDRFIGRMTRAREKILNNTINVFKDKAIEAHTFGSVGRGDSDELSDIDIWFTYKDSDIKDVLAKRMELYSEIGEIVHLCEPPQNAPIDGVHSFVLYKTEVGLLQVDLYLCPQSTSFLTKDSKKIFSEIDLPRMELSLNPNRVLFNKDYRIDFVIFIAFIAIKKLARNKSDALGDLLKEYGFLSEKYGIKVNNLEANAQSFAIYFQILSNIKNVSNSKQFNALAKIEKFARTVEYIKGL